MTCEQKDSSSWVHH